MQYLIGGMHCASCVHKIEKAIQGVPGVTRVAVNFATEIATVEGAASPDALAAAVRRVGGYTIAPLDGNVA